MTQPQKKPLEKFKMETHFEGLIQLLAKSLYPDPDVFVRELIQNGHDSIVRRQQQTPKPEGKIEGKIAIALNPSTRTLTFRDNGIGMDVQDIKQFLSVIGSTGTGTARKSLQTEGRSAAYNLIGQFGIGMLSAFVVAEKVVVTTRKLGHAEAFAWHNYGSTDCELYPAELETVGSEITVFIHPDYLFILDEKRIENAVVKYCDFIQFDISLNGQGPINAVTAPWYKSHWTSPAEKEASYKAFLNRRYPDVPLEVIPIDISEPFAAKGALYITDRRIPDVNTTGVMDIFVRRMFVRAEDNTLLPPWAKFVRGIIDSPDLQPTAARDNIQRNHPSFEFFQAHLGQLIVDRLSNLAANEPSKFRQINHWHHYHLKGMAYFHDDFFEQVADLLLFETNEGDLSLSECLVHNKGKKRADGKTPLYYFAHRGSAAQFYKLSEARGWAVINAGYRFEEEVLQKYARQFADTVYLERLDAVDDPDLFQRLNDEEVGHFRDLELDTEKALRDAGISSVLVQMRRFEPASLPAVIIMSPETETEEKLRNLVTQPWFMEGMEDIATEALQQSRSRPTYLSLNISNPLIQTLAKVERQAPVVKETLVGIYNSARLYGNNLLNPQSVEAMHNQFISLFSTMMAYWSETQELEGALWTERRQRLRLQLQANNELETPAPPPPKRLSQAVLKGLRLQLQPTEAEQLMAHYPTVEALLEAIASEAAATVGIPEFMIQAIQSELQQHD